MWDWDLCEKDDKPISRKIRVIGTIPALSFFLLFCVFIFWFYTFFLSSLIFFSYYLFIEDFFESILNFLKYHMSGTYPKISPQNKNDEKKLSFRIKFDEISPPPKKRVKVKGSFFLSFWEMTWTIISLRGDWRRHSTCRTTTGYPPLGTADAQIVPLFHHFVRFHDLLLSPSSHDRPITSGTYTHRGSALFPPQPKRRPPPSLKSRENVRAGN